VHFQIGQMGVGVFSLEISLRAKIYKSPEGEWGLGIVDWGLAFGDWTLFQNFILHLSFFIKFLKNLIGVEPHSTE